MDGWREGLVEIERAHDGDECLAIGVADFDGKEPIYAVRGSAFATVNGGRTLSVRIGRGASIPIRAAGARIHPVGANGHTIRQGVRVAVAGRRETEPVDGSYRQIRVRTILVPDARGELRFFLLDRRDEPIIEPAPAAIAPAPAPARTHAHAPTRLASRPDRQGVLAFNDEGTREGFAAMHFLLAAICLVATLVGSVHMLHMLGFTIALAWVGGWHMTAERSVKITTTAIELRDRTIPIDDVVHAYFLGPRRGAPHMKLLLRDNQSIWFYLRRDVDGYALASTIRELAMTRRRSVR
jgi:hypothetical protein